MTVHMLRLLGRKGFVIFMLALVILSAFSTVTQSLNSGTLSIPSTGKICYYPGKIGSNVWTADFEIGNLSQFSSVDVNSGNLLEVTSTVKYNGSYCMHLRKEEGISTAKGVYEVSSSMYDFHFGFSLMAEYFATTRWVRLFELRPRAGGEKLVQMDFYSQGNVQIHFVNGETAVFPISDGQWYVIDIYVSSDGNGMVFIYLDGTPLVAASGLDWTDGNGNPYYLRLIEIGCVYSGEDTGHGDLYYDDIRLDEWIPPERDPQPPTSFFIYYPTTPEPWEEVTFYGYYSQDVDGNITRYLWDFGDGSTGEGMNVTHAFMSEGVYTVTLDVTDDSNLSSSIASQILVETRTPVSSVGWALPLHVEGKKILDADGNDVTLNLTGASKMGPEYDDPTDGGAARETNPIYYENDTDLMKNWGIKLLRLPFKWKWYMTRYEYREVIKQLVDIVTSRGIVVIMDVHEYMGLLKYWPAFTEYPKEFYWECANDAIISLKAVAHDFLYNPMVIGVEINEFRPNCIEGDADWDYQFKFELTKKLAEEVHLVNPNLLIGIEIGSGGGGALQDSYINVRPHCKSIIDSLMNIVYMPHIYFCSGYGRYYIWDMYSTDPEAAKTEMYRVMNDYYLGEQQYYNLPVIVTEWGSDSEQGSLVINDQFEYFISHNWGSTYWAWFRQPPGRSPYGMGLLLDDWETPSLAGEAFKEKLAEIYY